MNTYFQVTINNISGDSPSDGFIDSKLPNSYIVYDKETSTISNLPTDITSSTKKARGNIRWNIVKEQLGYVVNVVSIDNIIQDGGDINTPPNSITFVVCYERPDYLEIEDELNPGTKLSVTDSVSRFVERALCSTRTLNYTIINPDSKESIQGILTTALEVGQLSKDLSSAKSSITVQQIIV